MLPPLLFGSGPENTEWRGLGWPEGTTWFISYRQIWNVFTSKTIRFPTVHQQDFFTSCHLTNRKPLQRFQAWKVLDSSLKPPSLHTIDPWPVLLTDPVLMSLKDGYHRPNQLVFKAPVKEKKSVVVNGIDLLENVPPRTENEVCGPAHIKALHPLCFVF